MLRVFFATSLFLSRCLIYGACFSQLLSSSLDAWFMAPVFRNFSLPPEISFLIYRTCFSQLLSPSRDFFPDLQNLFFATSLFLTKNFPWFMARVFRNICLPLKFLPCLKTHHSVSQMPFCVTLLLQVVLLHFLMNLTLPVRPSVLS